MTAEVTGAVREAFESRTTARGFELLGEGRLTRLAVEFHDGWGHPRPAADAVGVDVEHEAGVAATVRVRSGQRMRLEVSLESQSQDVVTVPGPLLRVEGPLRAHLLAGRRVRGDRAALRGRARAADPAARVVRPLRRGGSVLPARRVGARASPADGVGGMDLRGAPRRRARGPRRAVVVAVGTARPARAAGRVQRARRDGHRPRRRPDGGERGRVLAVHAARSGAGGRVGARRAEPRWRWAPSGTWRCCAAS